jgi:hypothetical protein
VTTTAAKTAVATTAETRVALQQVAVHVLARRRHAMTGRFGLRPTPGGLGTPLFGEGEVVRISGDVLVVERDREAWDEPLTTLARAAMLVRVDLAEEFSVGPDTPPLADPEADLGLDATVVRGLGDWWAMGAVLMDELVATTPEITVAGTAQLWPEHFDHASTVTLARGGKVNVGASPGDGFEPQPYVYLSPWGPERPGDPAYWNAPFGAVWRGTDDTDPLAFLRRGIELLFSAPAAPGAGGPAPS